MPDNPKLTEFDQAVRARLARLATVPVDTSNLEHRLRAAMTLGVAERSRRRLPQTWGAMAAAAVLIVAATLGLVLMNFGNAPATASPTNLARLHAQTMHSDAATTTVTTVAQANVVLAAQWRDTPQAPTPSDAQLHACCIHDFMESKVACLLLADGQTPLTLVVGRAREFRPAEGRLVERGGRTFTLHEVNGLRMAMTQQDERFICLMGEISEDRLLDLAQGLQF